MSTTKDSDAESIGAKSLHQLAISACIANLRYVFDLGEAPYDVVRPVLLKLQNPQQLRDIEKASPQICGADAEIWRSFIKRDIPDWQAKVVEPKDPQNWWKVYRKLKREADENSKRRATELKDKLNQLDAEKASQHITFDHTLTVPTRKRHFQPQAPRPKPPDSALMTIRSGPGSKTKTVTGSSILHKARREAREASRFTALRPAPPTSPPKRPAQSPTAASPTRKTATSNPSPAQTAAPANTTTTPETKEEALARRQRALASKPALAGTSPTPLKPNTTPKRTGPTNVFMPVKKPRT